MVQAQAKQDHLEDQEVEEEEVAQPMDKTEMVAKVVQVMIQENLESHFMVQAPNSMLATKTSKKNIKQEINGYCISF